MSETVGFEQFARLVETFKRGQLDVVVMPIEAAASLLADLFFNSVPTTVNLTAGMITFGPKKEPRT